MAYGTSPAFTLHAEHPTGAQYANYLHTLATKAKLNVQCSTEVRAVRPLGGGEGFEVTVVPAGGEPTLTLTPTPTPSVTPTRTRTRTPTPTPARARSLAQAHAARDAGVAVGHGSRGTTASRGGIPATPPAR